MVRIVILKINKNNELITWNKNGIGSKKGSGKDFHHSMGDP